MEEFSNIKFDRYRSTIDILSRKGREQKTRIYKKIKDLYRERIKIINYWRENNRVISLDNPDLYNKLYNKYYSEFERGRLSEVDRDILVSGAIMSREKNTAIISNDFPILYLWKHFLKNEELDADNFGFFIRRDFNGFEKGKYNI